MQATALGSHLPLAKRVYSTNQKGIPPLTHVQQQSDSSCPRKLYKLWTEEEIRAACEAISQRGISVRRAALEYNIPKSTLQDRLNGKVLPGATSGPERYLSPEEENELAKFVMHCAKIGYARTRKQVLAIVEAAVQKKRGPTATVSPGWWYSFLSRHSELTMRTAENLAYARAVAQDQTILDKYFDLLERTLLDNELINSPSRIFNVDESGFPLQQKSQKVVARKGTKHPTVVTTGDKCQITVIACANAAGSVIPPMVIFDRKTLKSQLSEGEIPETIYGLTDNGWSNADMFDTWFHNQFLVHAGASRPILLLMDGHSSHYNPSTVRKASEEGVILFCLPPHTTHFAQPLDVSCFGVLKSRWHEECHQFVTDNPGRVVTRFDFSTLFSRAWRRAMVPSLIISSFKESGVYPLNPSAFIATVSIGDESLERIEDCPSPHTNLKFIPLYSPSAPVKERCLRMFSREEEECFQQRFSYGYDAPGDTRYISWLQVYHPDEAQRLCGLLNDPIPSSSPTVFSNDQDVTLSSVEVRTLQPQSTLSKFLDYPKPPARAAPPTKKKSAKVLTSAENLKLMEEKEKAKREQQEIKEQRRREREAKQKLKQTQAAGKSRAVPTKRRPAASRWTHDELELYKRRYENGYDLTIDSKYIAWLEKYHPEEASRLQAKSTLPLDTNIDDDGDWSSQFEYSYKEPQTQTNSEMGKYFMCL